MSKRRDVILAVKALVGAAGTRAEIAGFDTTLTEDRRIGAGGLIAGDPGQPEEVAVDLSPLTYHFEHAIETWVYASPTEADPAAVLDSMLSAIGAAVLADRTLGGLCEWLDVSAPSEADETPADAQTHRTARIAITASYSTSDPLN